MKNIIGRIQKKMGSLQPFLTVADRLSASQVNSLLLTLFTRLSAKLQPAGLIRQFNQNRFVLPAQVDAIKFLELELECLQLARDHHFKPLILSPLAPLGSCSSVGPVNQNNIVSALRGTEVLSDATNVLAIKIADEFRKQNSEPIISYAATHRHVRSQYFTNPAYSAHFGVFCLASGGLDRGYYFFEQQQLQAHIKVHMLLLARKFPPADLFLKVYFRRENAVLLQEVKRSLAEENYAFEIETDYEKGDYYQQIQFKIFLNHKGMLLDLADGGLVDWTQQMIPNKKHRLFISGCGLELVEKLLEGQI